MKSKMNALQKIMNGLLPILFLIACGDDGTVNTSSSSTTTSSDASSSSGGTGGAAGGGGMSGATTTSTGTGGTGGAGGGTSGACTNGADAVVLNDPSKAIPAGVASCAQTNLGQEPATFECIKGLGLSDGCATCFDGSAQCIFKNCLASCIAGAENQACIDCRAMYCDVPFQACSGLAP